MIDDARPSTLMAFTAWSWRLGRLRGVEYRVSWTLLILMLFACVDCVHAKRFEWIPLAILIPLIAVLLHTWGHLLAAKWVGGYATDTVLGMFGDMTVYRLPLRWWPQFAVPAAGILTSVLLWLGCGSLDHRLEFGTWGGMPPLTIFPLFVPQSGTWWGYALFLLLSLSCSLWLWNLIPSLLFDGGRLWRGFLWPIIGLRRAVWWSILGGIACAGLLTILAIDQTNFIGFIFGIMLLISGVMEYRSMRGGYDLLLEIEPPDARRARDGLWARWSERRRQRRLERFEREEASEQEVLDRLLAKVSAEGLPALTGRERDALARISKKQKERQRELETPGRGHAPR